MRLAVILILVCLIFAELTIVILARHLQKHIDTDNLVNQLLDLLATLLVSSKKSYGNFKCSHFYIVI